MVTHSNLTQQGRFGNQLFQIAACIGHAVQYNESINFYPWPHAAAFKRILPNTLQHSHIENTFIEKGFRYSPIPYQKNLDISGYFQSEKYFAHCKKEVREIFEFKDDLVPEPMKLLANGACSIHVRRGDYLKIPNFHPPVTIDYLQQAVKLMEKQGVTHFLVFSDDMEWCRQNIKTSAACHFIDNYTPEQDMCLMSLCDHHIIANSSFSWWGAWLGKNPQKRVIYPMNWFGPDNIGASIIDLIPAGWEGIA